MSSRLCSAAISASVTLAQLFFVQFASLSDRAVQPLWEKAVVAASAPGVDDIQHLRRRAAECERVDVGWRDVGQPFMTTPWSSFAPDSAARTAEIAAVAGPWPSSNSTVRMFPA